MKENKPPHRYSEPPVIPSPLEFCKEWLTRVISKDSGLAFSKYYKTGAAHILKNALPGITDNELSIDQITCLLNMCYLPSHPPVKNAYSIIYPMRDIYRLEYLTDMSTPIDISILPINYSDRRDINDYIQYDIRQKDEQPALHGIRQRVKEIESHGCRRFIFVRWTWHGGSALWIHKRIITLYGTSLPPNNSENIFIKIDIKKAIELGMGPDKMHELYFHVSGDIYGVIN